MFGGQSPTYLFVAMASVKTFPLSPTKFPRPQVELVIFGDLDDDAVNRHVEIKGEDLGAFGITRVHLPHRFLQVGVQILLVVYAPDLFFSLLLILLLSWAAATFNHE